MMTVAEEKNKYRKEIKKRLSEYRRQSNLCIQEEQEASKILLSSQFYKDATTILAYAATPQEFSLDNFIQEAINHKKRIFLPKSHPHTCSMDFFQLENKTDLNDQLTRGSYGIREPLPHLQKLSLESLPEKTLILIPGLAFTREGKRLGKGMGFYDRFLCQFLCKNRIRKGVVLMGICHVCQIIENLPTEKNDILVDYLLTPSKILSCYH